MPWLADRGVPLLERLLLRFPSSAATEDGLPRDWVGPHVDALLELPPRARHLLLSGSHHPYGDPQRVLSLRVHVEGHRVGRFELSEVGAFSLRMPLPAGLLSPVHVELDSAPFFIPDEHLHNDDRRQVCFILDSLRVV